jgi:poly(3-hydroxybutyrate) depolymerase
MRSRSGFGTVRPSTARANRATRWILGFCSLSIAMMGCGGSKTPNPNQTLGGSGASGTTAGLAASGAAATAGASTASAGASAGVGGTGGIAHAAGSGGAGLGGAGLGAGGMTMMSMGGAGAGGAMAAVAGNGAAGGAGTGPVTAACTGKKGMLRGESSQMIMSGGMMRTFIHYAPQGIDANTPVPFVFIPHGYLMTGKGMADITQYEKLADREQVVLVFPDGADTAWNVGAPTCASTILGILPTPTDRDDQKFMDDVFKFAEDDQCIDHKHIFMTGFSMGGYFTNASGCERTDVRAVAPHSGGSYDFTSCKSGIIPALIMHFNGDGLIPTMCGTEARDRWIKKNGCQSASPDMKTVKGGMCSYYKGCMPGGQVAYCEFVIPASEMSAAFPGHGWSGGTKTGDSAQFAIPDTESATELTWGFFKQYAW